MTKEEHRAAIKKWKQEHPERCAAHHRKWQQESQEYLRFYHHEYYMAHREQILERKRKNKKSPGHLAEG